MIRGITTSNRLVSALLLLCLVSLYGQAIATEKRPQLPRGLITMDGAQAPLFTLKNLDGESLQLPAKPGHWVFVHFWASWSRPCRKEIPAIARLINSMHDSTWSFFIINTAETEDEIFNFLGIIAPNINSLMDSDGLVTEQWQPRGLPATYLVDPEGRLRYQALGGRPWDTPEYLDFLKQLAKKAH